MLKPYVCVACEKVIIEQSVPGIPDSAGVASLIALFSRIIVTPGPGEPIPSNAVAPKEWAIFSAWDCDPEDAGRSFEVCTEVLYPDKSVFGSVARQRLNIEASKRAQHVVKIMGFPIGQSGFYTVRTWIEENGAVVIQPIEFKIDLVIQ
jgi:hypothetical protein